MWRLAFRAWKKSDLDGARKWLELEHKMLPREDGWWEAGRTLYWLGRVEEKAGHADLALERWSAAAREYPLSFYALESLSRMHELAPEKAQALVEELSGPSGEKEPDWQFAPRPLFATGGFKRGLELARLGLGAESGASCRRGRPRRAPDHQGRAGRRRRAAVARVGAVRARRRVRPLARDSAPAPDRLDAHLARR